MRRPNLFFSVGEPSGDLHAARLISELRKLQPRASFRGLGGANMHKAGCCIDYDLTSLAVVGFVEVLPKLREFFRVAKVASDIFDKRKPDAVILVDFPGFNWHIAKRAKQRGIPVFYYLPPQLWAWGGWRIAKMRRTVDHVLCNLPFEPGWYEKKSVQVDYVGHPFFDEVHERQLDPQFLKLWRDEATTQVAVLPGSRTREVQNIWPMQLAAIRELSAKHPGTRFLVACLKDRHCIWCRQQLSEQDQHLNIHFFVGKTSEIIEASDCALMKSGSVSLEMMARGKPAVVVYHSTRALYAIARLLTSIKSMTLPNMIAEETIMPEFLAVGSSASTIPKIVSAMDRLIGDPAARAAQRDQLLSLSFRFAKPGASAQAASRIWELLGMDSNAAESLQLFVEPSTASPLPPLSRAA